MRIELWCRPVRHLHTSQGCSRGTSLCIRVASMCRISDTVREFPRHRRGSSGAVKEASQRDFARADSGAASAEASSAVGIGYDFGDALASGRANAERDQRPAGAGTRSPFGDGLAAPGAGIASQRGVPPTSLHSSIKPVAVFRRHAAVPALPLATPSCHTCDDPCEGTVSAVAGRMLSDAPVTKTTASATNAKACFFMFPPRAASMEQHE